MLFLFNTWLDESLRSRITIAGPRHCYLIFMENKEKTCYSFWLINQKKMEKLLWIMKKLIDHKYSCFISSDIRDGQYALRSIFLQTFLLCISTFCMWFFARPLVYRWLRHQKLRDRRPKYSFINLSLPIKTHFEDFLKN